MTYLFIVGATLSGGAEKRAYTFCNQIRKIDNSFIVALYGKKDGFDSVMCDSYATYKQKRIKEKIDFIRSSIEIFKPDVVVSFLPHINFMVCLALKKRNIKHCVALAIDPTKLSFKSKIMLKYAVRKCSRLMLQCEEQKKFFNKKVLKKSFVCYNPVDLNAIKTKIIKTNYAIKFLAVGRLSKQKNYELLIDSFASAANEKKNITLDIFGNGEEHSLLNDSIKKHHMEGIIKIHDYNPNIIKEYCNYDCLISTSLYEGFPNVVLEGMASGLIVLCCNFKTGLLELVDDCINGFITSYNPNDISSMILRLTNGKYDLISISQNAIKKASQFDVKLVINNFMKEF